jgi:hypothetical protein
LKIPIKREMHELVLVECSALHLSLPFKERGGSIVASKLRAWASLSDHILDDVDECPDRRWAQPLLLDWSDSLGKPFSGRSWEALLI